MKYSETALVIDLISMEYETQDPDFICRQAKQELNTYISPGQVKDHFNYTIDYEQVSHTIEMADIFN
jgi:hypothetical protein